MKITTLSRNLLNVVRHESEDRKLWTYLHDGRWHVSDEKPIVAGRDSQGRIHVDVNVKESFDDVESLLSAQRESGFHSWRVE